MDIKLFDSELKVMDVLWQHGALSAGQIAKILKADIGWNRNTTYTVIKKCIDKGTIERSEPNFMCRATVSRIEVQEHETRDLIDKMFSGSEELFFAAFIQNKNLSVEKIERLKKLINEPK